jgi:uracil-DNA glycosylase family 4
MVEIVKRRRQVIRDLAGERKKPANIGSFLTLGMYPLNAPGMPMPGPDFLEHARRLGDSTDVVKTWVKVNDKRKSVETLHPGSTLKALYRSALRDPHFTMPVEVRGGRRKVVSFVPGHIWGQYAREFANGLPIDVDGPRPADVMVLGKMPGQQEIRDHRNLVGESGQLLVSCLRELHVKGTPDWYVTNLCKFNPPDGNTTLRASWIKDCLPLLHQELRLVRPKYILCLGADASKALLGSKYSVTYMDGRVMEYEFQVDTVATEEPEIHKALVMTVVHPAQVARAPEMKRTLDRGLGRFNQLITGTRFDKEETDIDHREIRTLAELQSLLAELTHDESQASDTVAVDAEWHGEHPQNEGSYVRTIQFAWKPKHGCAVVLRTAGGKITFVDDDGKPAINLGIDLLNRYFKGKRVVGHFFVSDLEWLVHMGLDLRKQFSVPVFDAALADLPADLQRRYRALGYSSDAVIPAFMRTKLEGGADTGLMAHAIEETASLGLESLATRYTTVPRYDVPLHDWRVQYCRDNDLKSKDLEGYGECPDDILVPYGIYDADATLRLYYAFYDLLDHDYEDNNCREPFWESMLITGPILEIHRTGICVDKKRIDELTKAFMGARSSTEQVIQRWTKWPEFNIRSVMQVREFLFGEKYNGKVTKDGEIVRIRPKGGRSLKLMPILDTSKPPKPWETIRQHGLEHEHNAGTGKTILGVLAQENLEEADQINWVRDYRFLDQVLKSVLRPPMVDKATGEWMYEEGSDGIGGLMFDAGLASQICGDGRVRTHLFPTAETGRCRSARPNLQNLSKRRDDDYKRLLGKSYEHKLRSIITASPGHVLIEADCVGAELFGMAIMAGDDTMIDHCRRNQLPEHHPNHYDIHSHVAVQAFGLDCEPTKSGLKLAGKSAFRVNAKNVVFGIAYGRGAKAIALQAKEEGNPITVDEAQKIIDTVFDMYPGLMPFFAECRNRATGAGWLCHCFGRYRRFPSTSDDGLKGEFERQAQNFPIQGMVASAVNRALAYLQDYRDRVLEQQDMFRILLQIHDAVLLEAPYEHVDQVVSEVLPECMCKMVPIWPTTLDGTAVDRGPYFFGIDTEVMPRWGEHLTKEQASEWKIPLKYAS